MPTLDFQHANPKPDVKTKMIYLLGEINLESAIIIAEKTAFDVDNMEKLTSTGVIGARLLDENDIYRWFMVTLQQDVESAPAAKLSIIWPATQTVRIRSFIRSLHLYGHYSEADISFIS